jgi:GNAT superfamily N-acetyltransferase
MSLHYFDAKPYFETEPVREIMWSALAYPNDEMLDRLLQRYHDDENMRLVAAIDGEENLQAIVGLRLDDQGEATILHLRVQDDVQRTGIGSALVQKVIDTYGLHCVSSRSPGKLLPFYEKLGFYSWIVGEKPPGTTWYGVRWERGAKTS